MSDSLNIILPIGDDFNRGCLRSLSLDDVPLMLEWMHDCAIANLFMNSFLEMNENDVTSFIKDSWSNEQSLHLAIRNEYDEYLGTISLKNIDYANNSAEYAVVTRIKAHGTGIALEATNTVLDVGFNLIGLNRIYLNVKSSNLRAVSFYKKTGFIEEGVSREAIRLSDGFEDLYWFSMLKREWNSH